MTSPLFLEFIRKQLATGIARPDIEKVLKINGLTPAEIEEGFSVAGTEPAADLRTEVSITSAHGPEQIAFGAAQSAAKIPLNLTVPIAMQGRPRSVLWFEVLMYSAVVLNVFMMRALMSTSLGNSPSEPFLWLLQHMPLLLGGSFSVFLVYATARRRKFWAFIALVSVVLSVFLLHTFVFEFASLFFNHEVGGMVLLYVTVLYLLFILEIIAIFLMLALPARAWLFRRYDVQRSVSVNQTWAKSIPTANVSLLLIAAMLFVFVDSVILAAAPDLFGFWALMVGVLAIFASFFTVENHILSEKLSSSRSALDFWLFCLVLLRNSLFVLNVIPGIQLLGLVGLAFGGIPYLILYILLLYYRMKVR